MKTTPREELIWNFDIVFGDADAGPSTDETSSVLKYYAIGKWVPVSERLPEFGRSNMWSGTFKTDSGRVVTAQCHKDVFGTRYITHWLELDLPEVEQ